jgi:GTP-binding protein EngB required for normal cell division
MGRFKVGKSSFVNALTNSKLAGVSTNPETAAISVFRYSETTYAEIDIISKEKWQESGLIDIPEWEWSLKSILPEIIHEIQNSERS